MELRMLEWDSNFFGKKIYSLRLENNESIADAERKLKDVDADLVYVFMAPDAPTKEEAALRNDMMMLDHKLTYHMSLKEKTFLAHDEAVEYYAEPDADFIALARSSGLYSRFALDEKLNYKFDEMYEMWLRNSLNKKIADKVFVIETDNAIRSFITGKIKNNIGTIGLIATHMDYRGKSYGRKLIDSIHRWYQDNEVEASEVVTQKANTTACGFYENYGFTIAREELVYHWWIKK